jgi:hypothetical protein
MKLNDLSELNLGLALRFTITKDLIINVFPPSASSRPKLRQI